MCGICWIGILLGLILVLTILLLSCSRDRSLCCSWASLRTRRSPWGVARDDLSRLSPADKSHITTDIQRVYSLLILEWIKYMEYLKTHYPYLFSLAMQKNPFDESAR